MLDLKQIEANYKSLDDEKIIHLAVNEASSLEIEALELLKIEIEKRKLDPVLLEHITAQIKPVSPDEMSTHVKYIKELTCTECNLENSPIIGSIVRTVHSYVVVTRWQDNPIITCKSCANKLMYLPMV